MSEESKDGVTITTREIYDMTSDLIKQVNGIGNKIDNLQREIKKQNDISDEVSKVSKQALETAKESHYKAENAKQNADIALSKVNDIEREHFEMKEEQYKKEIEQHEKDKNNRMKFYIAIASATIPWVMAFIFGIIYIFEKGGL